MTPAKMMAIRSTFVGMSAERKQDAICDLFIHIDGLTTWNRDMSGAPRDGTLLLLLVEYDPDDINSHAVEDALIARTIGFNNFDNDGDDVWQIAGYCWSHDHFTEGHGKPIGWLPIAPLPPS